MEFSLDTLKYLESHKTDDVNDLIERLKNKPDPCLRYSAEDDELRSEAAATITALRKRVEELEGVLGVLLGAEALNTVRITVAGWNGEGREDGHQFERHPSTAHCTIPTTCGAIYDLDDALKAAAALRAKGGEHGDA